MQVAGHAQDRAKPCIWRVMAVLAACLWPGLAFAADITPFVGSYSGTTAETLEGEVQPRDLSVTVGETRRGFTVTWVSTSFKAADRTKEAAYTINFVPTDREGLFSAAQRESMFGQPMALDPMKGDPMVWARISGDTLSVYSLFVDFEGGYQIQEYHRTLTEGGLDLVYRSVRNAEIQRSVEAFLARE